MTNPAPKAYTFAMMARTSPALSMGPRFTTVAALTYAEASNLAMSPESNGGLECDANSLSLLNVDGVRGSAPKAGASLNCVYGSPANNEFPQPNIFVGCDVEGFCGSRYEALRWDGERWFKRDGRPFGLCVYSFDDNLDPTRRVYTPASH